MVAFHNHYVDWRKKRIEKILKIFEKDYFKDKLILEVACGYGDIGKYFRENLGSRVVFTEGREEHLPFIKQNNPDSLVIHLNHENYWKLEDENSNHKKFDLVIHFGLLYHLDNWKQDLVCALKHSNTIILETEVADTNEIKEYKFYDPIGNDQSISESRKVTRPSAAYIEHVFQENEFSFTRYDDSDLNSSFHTYDWKVSDKDQTENNFNKGFRRFWVATKK
jgi:SAM-dependent methyltransferase